MQHVNIYRKKDRYAGWPANYGMWSWGDEIVLGWTVVKKAMADAAAAGGLRPTHLLGFKPVT